uniref:Uncharacterized protein n=1 Tax=Mucochytrium quahogii TaxID=96639 RepID=A0A7S2RS92_9STRA|mmetsp:Transcript_26240/g.42499  ORF Transcript_26240/g.42499 Transcript_26240/m.42499 type:complete len:461 (-) Transcript_26240:217-1599(-)
MRTGITQRIRLSGTRAISGASGRSFFCKMDVVKARNGLSAEEQIKWDEILNAETKLPKVPRGKKPSREEISEIKAFRTRKKEFLATLTATKRDALTQPKGQKKDGNSADANAKQARLHEEQMAELETLRIKGPNGEPCRLVDVGINIQTRFKKLEVQRQLERSFAAGVDRVILTGCSIKSSLLGVELCKAWYTNEGDNVQSKKFPTHGFQETPVHVYTTVGVHPHDAKTIADDTKVNSAKIDELRKLASSPFCVSLGECGLDYDRMFSPMETQKRAFEAQVQLAEELNRPLFVHLRELDQDKGEPLGAVSHFEEILGRSSLEPSKVCVHCFTGDLTDLTRLANKGYYIGLTGYVGMKKRASATGTLDAIGASHSPLSLERLLIETDSPFMRPDKTWLPSTLRKSKNNEPCVLPSVCRAIASEFHGGKHSAWEIAERTSLNAMSFFCVSEADVRISHTTSR